jgi:hypothetical protein
MVLAVLVLAGCAANQDSSANAPNQAEKADMEAATGAPETQEPVKTPAPENVEVPADVPAYTLTKDQATADPALGLRLRDVAASTDATAAEDLEAATRELWSETEGADALVVAFYPNEPMAEISGTGMAFADEEAARAVLSAQYADPSEADIDGQVREAMANDGITVLSIEDEVDAATEEMCAEWDTTTMGTPPPEWDC